MTEDLTGKKFGKLIVIGFAGYYPRHDGRNDAYFNCTCDCGNDNIISVKASSLKNGNTKSCGCLAAQIIKGLNRTHGKSDTRLYSIWCRMKQRCNNPNTSESKYYHDKGIRVCKEWDSSFEAFEKWALENGYGDSLTIDRINSEDGYCPENCRWVDKKEQTRNREVTRFITFDGKTLTPYEWERETGIKAKTILKRIDCLGWSVEDALSKPTREVKKR